MDEQYFITAVFTVDAESEEAAAELANDRLGDTDAISPLALYRVERVD